MKKAQSEEGLYWPRLSLQRSDGLEHSDDPALQDVRYQLKDRLLNFYLSTADVVPMQEDQRW